MSDLSPSAVQSDTIHPHSTVLNGNAPWTKNIFNIIYYEKYHVISIVFMPKIQSTIDIIIMLINVQSFNIPILIPISTRKQMQTLNMTKNVPILTCLLYINSLSITTTVCWLKVGDTPTCLYWIFLSPTCLGLTLLNNFGTDFNSTILEYCINNLCWPYHSLFSSSI